MYSNDSEYFIRTWICIAHFGKTTQITSKWVLFLQDNALTHKSLLLALQRINEFSFELKLIISNFILD